MGKFSKPRIPQPQQDLLEELERLDALIPTPAQPEEVPVPNSLDSVAEETADSDNITTIPAEIPLTDILSETPAPQTPEIKYSIPTKNPKAKNRKIVLISLCSVAVVALLGVIASLVYLFAIDPNDGKILNNVSVAGINIGNMTKSEAKAAIRAATDNTFSQKDMVIHFPDIDMHLSPADTGVALDVNALINDAFDYGRVGTEEERQQALDASMVSEHPIALLPYLKLNKDFIRQQLNDYEKTFNSVYSASTVEMDGDMPILNGDDEGYTGQIQDRNLIIYLGTPGRHIDFNQVYNRILDAYSFNQFELTVEMDEEETIPEVIDLKTLYDQYYSEVRDAYVDPETYEVTMEVYGYEFDLEAAQAQMDNAFYGDTITIPMILTAPQTFGGE